MVGHYISIYQSSSMILYQLYIINWRVNTCLSQKIIITFLSVRTQARHSFVCLVNIFSLVCFVHYKKYFFNSYSINPTYKSVYISIYDEDIKSSFVSKTQNQFYLPFSHLIIYIHVYSQTYIKRSHLRPRKNGLIRQVTSQKRFNSYEIFYDMTKKSGLLIQVIEVTTWTV